MPRRIHYGANESIITMLKNGSIWEINVRKDFPPLVKLLLSIRDRLVEAEVYFNTAVSRLSSWGLDRTPSTSMAYEYLKGTGPSQIWSKVVRDPRFLPKFSFLLWLAISGRLLTTDKLHFLEMDKTCKLSNQQEENISHLFFACPFTANIWKFIKEWARLRRKCRPIEAALNGYWRKTEGHLRGAHGGSYVFLQLCINYGNIEIELFFSFISI